MKSPPSLQLFRTLRLVGTALFLTLAGGCGARVGAADAPTAPARAGNRLKDSTSPYLLQHARNPVDWYPWGAEAFERAKKEGKPVFLSIGYSACHWCHVMERESFEDEGIAAQLNKDFIAIKVDREERPDVDDLYMTAVQILTGSGGWPLSVYLTADGKPFHGGTYLPRNDFAEQLRMVHEAWSSPERRKAVERQAERLSDAAAKAGVATPGTGPLTTAVLRSAAQSYLEEADLKEGGFGGAPKFPPSLRLAMLLEENRKKPEPRLMQTVRLTLDRMARGGVYDQVGGGFHRYSVDAKWRVPHFEKMLYDNALLSWVYLRAYQETRSEEYRRIALETLEFALRELRDPAGGFWSTLDADSRAPNGEREEGRFYLWTPEEVNAALGAPDSALFCKVYDITAKGNFEGRSIPNLLNRPIDAWAKELKLTPEALRKRLDGMREKLRAAREKRSRPALDDKVLANWNGLMLRSLALAHEVTGDARYRQAAEQTAGFILDKMRSGDRLVHAYRGGRTQPQVFLEDYGYVIVGLTELARTTGTERWKKEAATLGRTMLRDFWDEKASILYDTPHVHEALLLARASRAEDNATPSGQSMAALALVRLGHLTGETGFRETAQKVLERQALSMKRFPGGVAGMLLATQAYFAPEEAAGGTKVSDPVTVGPGDRVEPGKDGAVEMEIRLQIAPGWHINGPDGGKENGKEGRIPTTLTLGDGPYQLVGTTFPPARPLQLGGEKVSAYTGEAKIRFRYKLRPGAKPAEELRVNVRYQPCNDRACLLPVTKTVVIQFSP